MRVAWRTGPGCGMSPMSGQWRCKGCLSAEIALRHLPVPVFQIEMGLIKVLLEPEGRKVFELESNTI